MMTQLFEPLKTSERYTPEPWQLEDIDFLSKGTFSANWSEMGTYKTTTGIWLFEKLLEPKRTGDVLIITSKNGKGTYFDALPKTIPTWDVFNVGIRKSSELIGDVSFDCDINAQLLYKGKKRVFLAHYDCFSNKSSREQVGRLLLKHNWAFVLCDEAHRLKNKDTQWTRNIKKLKRLHTHLMTGTGFVNDPSEIWSLLNFLAKDVIPRANAYWSFRNYFCDEYRDDRGFRVIIGVNPQRKQEFRDLRKSLGPRRYMRDVHKHIKEPIYAHHEVDLNPVQRQMYDEIKRVLQTLDQKGEPITSPTVLSQLTRLRQVCVATPEVIGRSYDAVAQRVVLDIKLTEPSSKLDKVMELLEEIDEAKVVIFSNFRDPLELLETRFDKAKIPYLHMLQKHNDRQRYEMWHDRFPSGDYRVFMSTIALGGESINLTPAQYLIFLDKSWSPKDMMQAVGRIYRPGQTQVPEIIHINARKTTDQRVQRKLDIKGRWFQEIFGDEE